MPDQNDKLQKIIQGGAIGICVLLIALICMMFDRYDKLANRHMMEFTDVMQENTRVLTELKNILANPYTATVISDLIK